MFAVRRFDAGTIFIDRRFLEIFPRARDYIRCNKPMTEVSSPWIYRNNMMDESIPGSTLRYVESRACHAYIITILC